MTSEPWQNFCIVGLGSHARTKLIPAILVNNQQVVGMVSRQSIDTLPAVPIYGDINSALDMLPPGTVFVIATPPALHFDQICTALEKGRDVIVEKPICITAQQAQEIAFLSKQKNLVVVENFMHRYTELYKRFLDFWRTNCDQISQLEITFLIPDIPPDTFRGESVVASSCLYDMGCYGISLLADLSMPLGGLRLMHITRRSDGQEAISIIGTLNDIEVKIHIGVATEYRNVVEASLAGGSKARFWPFFYGRTGDRWFSLAQSFGPCLDERLEEGNAFEQTFKRTRDEWEADQAIRIEHILNVTSCLEKLGREFLIYRSKVK